MGNTRKQVLVIGGGLAGITAALAAAKYGAQVTLVTSGPGTFALSGGTVSIQGMSSEQPYLEEAIDFFRAMTAAAGCEYKGACNERTFIPNIMGGFQEVLLAPASVWAGRPVNGSKVIVAGIHGLSGFSAQLTAELLSAAVKKLGIQVKYSAATTEIPRLQNHSFTSLDVANYLEDKQNQKHLAELVQPLVRDNDLLLLPAIFGSKIKEQEFAEFIKQVGCSVGELVTVPPSMAGLRVFQLLQRYLTQAGVESNPGYPVQALQLEDGLCTAAILDTPGRKRVIKAQSIIVATGRINRNSIAITIAGKDNETFLQEDARVNEQLQLVNKNNLPVAANVYGAGNILETYECKSGNALAIVTGYRAGMLAAGVAR
ncbi:FAD-dependent oxidoreductase [Sporomusa sp. KB1]|uniref:FAD-dependent oxidoreductase n=1 Tax=Sporomusa sp. KB1 TaxID=943346 RepID=UPI0011A9F211|nr:FAD-dependent oxidoreductase [Sporomusa sp. KB1]TWH45058.1 anaerobic glycerol-3-phosphate dehydrogenase [Sporomusa sp. KB1]